LIDPAFCLQAGSNIREKMRVFDNRTFSKSAHLGEKKEKKKKKKELQTFPEI
jgi:hypothetical protein